MHRFDTPIQITVAGLPVEIIGTDTGSYVSIDGRTWPVASDESIEAATVEGRIQDFVTNPPPPVLSETQIWEEFLNGNIVDDVTGYAMKANRQARNDFIGQATLLSVAISGGQATLETSVSIWDAGNVERTMTAGACLALLTRYGFAWQTAFNELAP